MKLPYEVNEKVAQQVQEVMDRWPDVTIDWLLLLGCHYYENVEFIHEEEARKDSLKHDEEIIGVDDNLGFMFKKKVFDRKLGNKAIRVLTSNCLKGKVLCDWGLISHSEGINEPFCYYTELYKKSGINDLSKFDSIIRCLEHDNILRREGDLISYEELRKQYQMEPESTYASEQVRLFRQKERKIYASKKLDGNWLKKQILELATTDKNLGQ